MLTDKARELFDGTNFVTLSTIDPDGQPQSSVVWARVDGDDILISTVKGRRKHANMERDARVTLCAFDQDNPYVYGEIRGTATITDDPDGSLIQELSQRYTGQPWKEHGPAERVIVRVSPTKVFTR